MPKSTKKLQKADQQELMLTLRARFEKNMARHKGINWSDVEKRLSSNTEALWSLNEMERTEGEPDVIGFDKKADEYIYCDCSPESPKGRRSICYDHEALESRKEHKPGDSAINMANEMGIEILNEEQYHELQKLGKFDLKTSSWLRSPDGIRKLGGAIFGDCRFGRVFIYHNGAESYYAARGFRGLLRI
jgi:hypothetical protein